MTEIQKVDEDYNLGPVITIAREYGCYGSRLAEKLSREISKESTKKWEYITKEILEDSAKQLDVRVKEIAHIFAADKKNAFADLIVSLAKKKYASDDNIKKAIVDIVTKYAEEGNIIIVGRAGYVLAKHIPKAIHINIVAPFEYRVNEIAKVFNLDYLHAERLVNETDKKRQIFMSFFTKKKTSPDLFDVTYNKSKMDDDKIVKSIIELAKLRNIIE